MQKENKRLRECYQKMNGNYEDVKTRLVKEERIEKFVVRFLKDDSYQLLCKARAAEDYEEVFRAVHSLKGASLNLGFTRLYGACSRLTEAVRGGKKPEDETLYEAVEREYRVTVAAIEEYKRCAGERNL